MNSQAALIMMRRTVWLPRVLCSFGLALFSAQGAIPTSPEAEYAEAVVAYHGGDHRRALSIVDRLSQKSPNAAELLELKALVLRSKQDWSGATAIYQRLVQLKAGDTRGASPYHFELGVIALQQKNTKQARSHLRAAMGAGFNSAACQFYLGVTEMQDKRWNNARRMFEQVLESGAPQFLSPSRLYLAQLAAQRSDGLGAIRHYVEARSIASAQVSDSASSEQIKTLARQVAAAAERDLRAYDRSVIFGSLGLLGGYDSNSLVIPDGATAGSVPSSPMAVIQYGIGYASTPIKKWQWIPSYRGVLNLNTETNTKSAQYFTHNFSVYGTKEPFAKTSYGFKVEGIGQFQYQNDPNSGKGKFAAYNFLASLGPFVRTEHWPKWWLGVETFFQPQKFYLDPFQAETFRRSGWGQVLRGYLSKLDIGTLWNPSISLGLEWNQTTGEEFRSRRIILDFSDVLYVSPQLVASAGVGIAQSWYPARVTGSRSDQTLVLTTSGGYRAFGNFNLIANLQYILNVSNISSYRYKRFIGSAGLSYIF